MIEFNSQNKSRQFIMGLLNVHSLNTGWDELVASFRLANFDVICLTETWLKTDSDIGAYAIPGYNLIHKPRCGRGGGVGVYVRSNLRVKQLNHPDSILEQLWIDIKIKRHSLLIGIAYRPELVSQDIAIDALDESLSIFGSNYEHVFVVGDININCIDRNNHVTLPKCFEVLTNSYKLHQIVNLPTRITPHTSTLIDVIFTRVNLQPTSVDVVHNDDLSDHGLVIATFPISVPNRKPRTVQYRPLTDNAEYIKKASAFSPWELILEYNELNDMVNLFNFLILDLIDTFAPVCTRKFKNPPSPWMTNTLMNMRNIRNKACRKAKKCNSESAIKFYQDMRNIYNCAVRVEKQAYFTQFVNNNINNSSLMWRHINKTIKNGSSKSIPEHLLDATKLNTHFINSVPALSVDLKQFENFESIRRSNISKFNFNRVSASELQKIINSFSSNSKGCDEICMNMIKLTLPYSLVAIEAIVNKSLLEGVFADVWKCSLIIPIPKKQKIDSFDDLRPISILPALSKIVEKCAQSQITSYLKNSAILPVFQSGFRQKFSTTTALLHITDDILTAADNGQGTILVLLDFSRAFDCVNIPLLLAKLKIFGFSETACSWFQSYFYGRSQKVKCINTEGNIDISEPLSISKGVIQGSILGPTLFALYTTDIKNVVQHSKYHLYADDTQLYVHMSPTNDSITTAVTSLNNDLKLIDHWSKSHGLLLNPKKSTCIIMGTRHQVASIKKIDPTVMINDTTIPRDNCIRNLGLNMDEGLTFVQHVQQKIGKCFGSLKSLYKIRSFLKPNIRLRLCNSLVLSHLHYCDLVYGPCLSQKTIGRIQRVQNACMRYCFDIPRTNHITPYLLKNNILNMSYTRKLKYACFVHSLNDSQCPHYLYDKLFPKCRLTRLRRRGKLLYILPTYKRVKAKGCFKYAASKIWNNIPPPLQEIVNTNLFRKKYKVWLLEQQKLEAGMKYYI